MVGEEERTAARLASSVSGRVFPALVRALAAAVPSAELHRVALRLLFRMVFLPAAESRGLVAPGPPGLRLAEVAQRLDAVPPAVPTLPDATLAPLLDALAADAAALPPRRLGEVCGQWLDGGLAEDAQGHPAPRPDAFARRRAGTYYTPDELVQLVLRRTLAPLLEDRRQAFRQRAQALADDPRPVQTRLRELRTVDAATAFLGLSVCDPAMGAGHFLLGLVDHVAATAANEMAAAVPWGRYRSPLAEALAAMRTRLRVNCDDGPLLRRMVLARVVHGVDLNPMAVELAKLALGLHCSVRGAPPVFLDHHLRCGDALFGELDAGAAAVPYAEAEALAECAPGEARSRFAVAEKASAKLRARLDRRQAERWSFAAGRWLHWKIAFSTVWGDGFDAMVGNPPWERMKMQEVEWFAAHLPELAATPRAADRKHGIAVLRTAGATVVAEYDRAARRAAMAAHVARTCGAYPLLSSGDVNLYALFVERAAALVRDDGMVGLLVPSGIAADQGAAAFFRAISGSGRLAALLDFENRRTALGQVPFFAEVDARFKFCVLVFGGSARRFAQADCAFFLHDADNAATLALAPADFAAVNPNTGTAPMFRGAREAALVLAIHRRLPVLVDRRCDPPTPVWPLRFLRMFDMTNDSARFHTAAELRDTASPEASWLPLYEGKMVQAYDHRAASVAVNAANLKRPAQPVAATGAEHADPAWRPIPRFWVAEAVVARTMAPRWTIGLKLIASPTNARTVIAAILPPAGVGNSLGVLVPESDADAAPILANLNTLVLDFVCRQKIQGQNINWYMAEQLPFVPREAFARRFGPYTAAEIVRDDVLHLTAVAHDMVGFARTLGHAGPPFAWDAEERQRRRARLDALFFHLYGLARDDAAYVLDSFAIDSEAKRLVLGFMAGLADGRVDAIGR